jgi:hypothetical protein
VFGGGCVGSAVRRAGEGGGKRQYCPGRARQILRTWKKEEALLLLQVVVQTVKCHLSVQ